MKLTRLFAPSLAAQLLAALILLVAVSSASGAEPNPLALPVVLAPGSKLWLEGKSNVHDFHSQADELRLTMGRDSAAVVPADLSAFDGMIRAGDVKAMTFSIPVAKMHSGKDGLDKNMQKALKTDHNPTIDFRLLRYQATPFPLGGDSLDVKATGKLSVAGVEREVELRAVARRSGNFISIEGSKPLLMTDFGVKPPTMMLGAMRTEDGVVIHYKLLLEVNASAAASTEERRAQ
jgi:polyisoprenoid-binding protein YceI